MKYESLFEQNPRAFIVEGIKLTLDESTTYEQAKEYLAVLDKQDLQHARPVFDYWKKKFDRLATENSFEQLRNIYEEVMFNDWIGKSPSEMDKYHAPTENATQLSSKLFTDCWRRKLWESRDKGFAVPKDYESFDYVKDLMVELCKKHNTTFVAYMHGVQVRKASRGCGL